jgi:hypothetical protein
MDALSRKARRLLSLPEVRNAVHDVARTGHERTVDLAQRRPEQASDQTPRDRTAPTDITSVTIRPSRG